MQTEAEFNRPANLKAIADRAMVMEPTLDRMGLMMDLSAANGVNGNPAIDWDTLLAAPDFTFAHDVFGIVGHMDRETGRLRDHFLPRCTVKEAA